MHPKGAQARHGSGKHASLLLSITVVSIRFKLPGFRFGTEVKAYDSKDLRSQLPQVVCLFNISLERFGSEWLPLNLALRWNQQSRELSPMLQSPPERSLLDPQYGSR